MCISRNTDKKNWRDERNTGENGFKMAFLYLYLSKSLYWLYYFF